MRATLAATVLTLAATARAQGGPPMLTDDPGTPPLGKWELNLAYTQARSHQRFEAGVPLVDLNYGARPNLQLKAEAPWTLARENGESAHDVGAALLGVKWRFQDERGGRPAWSTFPQVETALLSRSVGEGLAEPGTGVLLPVEVQWHRARLGFNLDAGVFFRAGEGPAWLGGGAVSLEVAEGSEALAELHFEGSVSDRTEDCVAQVGLRHDLGPSATFLAAAGRSVFTRGVAPTRFTAYFGLQLRF